MTISSGIPFAPRTCMCKCAKRVVGCRLLDIVHADQKLYLVFEFLDIDLKRYMEHANTSGTPISIDISKVRCVLLTCVACGDP